MMPREQRDAAARVKRASRGRLRQRGDGRPDPCPCAKIYSITECSHPEHDSRPDQHALAVNIRDLKRDDLRYPQTSAVGYRQCSLAFGVPRRLQQARYLLGTQDLWQLPQLRNERGQSRSAAHRRRSCRPPRASWRSWCGRWLRDSPGSGASRDNGMAGRLATKVSSAAIEHSAPDYCRQWPSGRWRDAFLLGGARMPQKQPATGGAPARAAATGGTVAGTPCRRRRRVRWCHGLGLWRRHV
jgi:hypothetical protein